MPVSKAKTAYGLLGEIRRLILDEPLRYDQTEWLERDSHESYRDEFPACGTIGCVAGWVGVLTGFNPAADSITWYDDHAKTVLGLTDSQAARLFRGNAAGRTEPQTVEHARKGAAHIERFRNQYRAQLQRTKIARPR